MIQPRGIANCRANICSPMYSKVTKSVRKRKSDWIITSVVYSIIADSIPKHFNATLNLRIFGGPGDLRLPVRGSHKKSVSIIFASSSSVAAVSDVQSSATASSAAMTPSIVSASNAVQAATNQMGQSQKDCSGCQKPITERFLLKALDLFWHEDCLKCGCCDCRLGEVGSTLYTKANLILCKRDYLRWV